MTTIQFASEISVEEIQQVGTDETLARAAWVSTGQDQMAPGGEPISPAKVSGLIHYLMKNRHGCYDDETEVLTSEGWKRWPDVTGREQFLTLNLDTDQMEYQQSIKVIHKRGPQQMVRLDMIQVDALVTPDHRMIASQRVGRQWVRGIHPAHWLLENPCRLHMRGGFWNGSLHAPAEAALAGFIAADGYVGSSSIEFHLHKTRKIKWLAQRAELGRTDNRYRLLHSSAALRFWAESTYTPTKDRCLPRAILLNGDEETIQALLDGYLMGDGSVGATGKITASTVSSQMVDDLQEAALKAGMAAVETTPDLKRLGAYGNRTLRRLTFYRNRNSTPRIGWTIDARKEQVRLEEYGGDIHCVAVPNGTLYVRRNGKPMWCGNTPFEAGFLTVRVHAPIKVWREWHRHRVGFSYNEMSGRYVQLEPIFYLPPRERPMIRSEGFKSARPAFDTATGEEYDQAISILKRGYQEAYTRYEELLALDVDRGLARDIVGVGIYSACWVSCNPRSLMHFLELRTDHPEAKRPSKPLYEIAAAAQKLEAIFARYWPITHQAWVEYGRCAP